MKDIPKADSPKRLPRFRSHEEEAEFWDTHDSTEFEHLFRPTRVKVADNLRHVLGIPMEPEVIDRLLHAGRQQGISWTLLAAKLISEGLDRMGAEPAPARSRKGKDHG